MKTKNTTIALAICLIMLLGALSLEQSTVSSDSGNNQSSNTLNTIFINENTTAPLNESWSNYNFPGDGSVTHPYIVEGTVECSFHQSSIQILNTKAYFILRLTYPASAHFYGCAIILENVTHGQIEESTISNQFVNVVRSRVKIQQNEFNQSQLIVANTNNSLIEGNTFQGTVGFMSFYGSNNNTIADNTINGSWIYGITLNHSNDNIIKNNTFINVNYTYQDYSGTNNVFITKIATTSKKTPGLTFELLILALISIVVLRNKRIKK